MVLAKNQNPKLQTLTSVEGIKELNPLINKFAKVQNNFNIK